MSDLYSAIQERDAALESVASRSGLWMDEALLAIAKMHGSYFSDGFTGEELRVKLISGGLRKPHHHNAWGALVKKAVSGGLIKPTGRHRNMSTPKSHARSTQVYEWFSI